MAIKKKEALGKGIRALLQNIGSDNEYPAKNNNLGLSNGNISEVSIESIEANPFQPRTTFEKEALNELSQSIKVHGVIQPITLRKLDNNKYQLISGERRLRASKIAGLKKIPAYIRSANDQEMLELALIENIQREDLNAIEVSINYKRLIDECNLKQEELADRIGKDRTTVTNYLRLLKLPPQIQLGLKEKKISMGHARAIINIENVDTQLSIYKQIITNELSVRNTEKLVRETGTSSTQKNQKTKTKEALPLELKKLQESMSEKLDTKVSILNKSKGKGEIVISYYSTNDLNRILEALEII